MHRFVRNLWLLLCGETGAIVGSMVALTVASMVTHDAAPWLRTALITIVLIRFISSFTKQHRAVLNERLLRTHLSAMAREEASITLAFLAACYVMRWPISHTTAVLFIAGNLAGQLLLFVATRLATLWIPRLARAFETERYERQAIIAGTGPKALKVVDAVLRSPELGTKLLGFLDYHKTGFWRYHDVPLIGHPDLLEGIVAAGQVDAIFLALEPEDIVRSQSLFHTAEKMGVEVYVLPELYRPEMARMRMAHLDGFQAVAYHTAPKSKVSLLAKGLLDRCGAVVAVTLAAPLLLITALLIRLDSPGPILFTQVRSGLNGKRFTLYKFRTMVTDAEKKKSDLLTQNEMSGPVFKIKEDPRVTRIGKVLRKYSIDELPQLFNVVMGDMSLVGPRPPLPAEVVKFEAWQRRKLSVKPGLTCLWQVNGRNAIDFDDWMRLDLQYIDNWSLLLDAKILVKTVPTVLSGSGS